MTAEQVAKKLKTSKFVIYNNLKKYGLSQPNRRWNNEI